jgi:hypothetical protein
MRQAPQAMSVGPLFLTGLALGPAFVRGNVLRELVACPCHMYSASQPGHPARRRCSSVEYSRYARSSRLAGGRAAIASATISMDGAYGCRAHFRVCVCSLLVVPQAKS